ncbi:MAG: tetratricopeptide repeat protein [Candidatus Omnitrophica bacterium]|nr:tetratricopeptide repeat protein [Candidatus Omnitrophota bacterium]
MSSFHIRWRRESRGRVSILLFTAILCGFQNNPVSAREEGSSFTDAVVAYQDRRLDDALRHAKKAVVENPNHVDAHFLLGELYYLKQDLTKAKESWQKALKLAPSRQDIRQRVAQLEVESKIEQDLARSDTHPFVVRFAEEGLPVDIGSLRQTLRDVYREVGQQFGYFPEHPITVILYPEGAFEQIRKAAHQLGGMYDGKIRLPVPQERNSRPVFAELKRVLWHEYTHAVVQDLSKGGCPIWLNEGLATLQESRVWEISLERFHQAVESDRLYAWDQFWNQPYKPQELHLQYQQAYLMAAYLVKRWGWSRMVSLLKLLGQGYSIQDAIRREYKTDPALVEKAWIAWVKRNY